ncbi:hypothetical protein BH23VER1_BH23VER1_13820 [soil metagenome]
MKPHHNNTLSALITKTATTAFAAAAFTFVGVSCTVEQTEEGEMPTLEGGNMPKYDVDPADVDIRTEEKTIKVPKVEINERPDYDSDEIEDVDPVPADPTLDDTGTFEPSTLDEPNTLDDTGTSGTIGGGVGTVDLDDATDEDRDVIDATDEAETN